MSCSTHKMHLHVAKTKGNAKKRILVLMSDTGGGHRASAEAIRSGFQILYGNQYHVSHCTTHWHMLYAILVVSNAN